MPDAGPLPEIPAELQIYNSYVEDPKWQRNFTYVWVGAVLLAILFAVPRTLHGVRRGRAFTGSLGFWEGLGYSALVGDTKPPEPVPPRARLAATLDALSSVRLFSLGGKLNLGQTLVALLHFALLLVSITVNAQLVKNPNRAGFLAIAQLPIVFLFATKNSVLSLLLGPGNGYERLNYIHRWSGRCMLLAVVIHGGLWLRNHLQYGLAIMGQQKEGSGIASFGLLSVIVLSSLPPVRKHYYQTFRALHIICTAAFFVAICYHTIYAPPWIFPPLALYGLDIFLRLFRFRIKDASLEAVDQEMTIIRIRDCEGGWFAGQHVRLRAFFEGRLFESHPLSIMSAPSAISCFTSPGLVLGARVNGDWTRALNSYASNGQNDLQESKGASGHCQVHVMLDGPYGGCSVDIGKYESALLICGGSGATFNVGLLDDIVGRCIKAGRIHGERTRRIEFAWCTRSFGSINWFAPQLFDIARLAAGSSLDLHISVFVTCLCDPEAVPKIPNMTVTVIRPSVTRMLTELLTSAAPRCDVEGASSTSPPSVGNANACPGSTGGVAVCVSGPESLTRAVQNAVARLTLTRGVTLGGIALHAELFEV